MSAPSSLPPGEMGLPFLGEVSDFLKDGFGFVEGRTERLGPVWKTKILGRPTAIIVGPDAAGQFIDESKIQREGGMLPHIQALFGGRALPVLDGEEHRERKAFVMAAFTRDALAGYLPEMQRLMAAAFAGWATGDELRWLDGFKRLSLEVISTTILGLPAGPTLDAVAKDYELVGGGFSSLPIPLPGTNYSRARRALDRILAVYATNAKEHLASPSSDGLSRILAARSARDGRQITVDEAKVELHHIVVAGLIVWAWFVTAVKELDRNPEIRERLRAEVASLPAGPLTLEALMAAPYLRQVSMEVRRLSPVVSRLLRKGAHDVRVRRPHHPGRLDGAVGDPLVAPAPGDLPGAHQVRPGALRAGAPRAGSPSARLRPERRGRRPQESQVRRLRVRAADAAGLPGGAPARRLPVDVRARSGARARLPQGAARAEGRPSRPHHSLTCLF